jgi:purine-binding chemotaxis protein CheW
MMSTAFAPEAALPPRQPVSLQVLEFVCRDQRFAVPLAAVRRAVPSARLLPLPGAADVVLGVLDVGGDTVTVLDFALRACGRPTVITTAQQFLILDVDGLPCALVVDEVVGPGTAVPDAAWPRGAGAAGYVEGAVRLADGLCLVVDPARFLFDHERAQLALALAGAANAHR